MKEKTGTIINVSKELQKMIGYRIICVVIGYVFGLCQTGYLYGKMNNVDIRDFGSGNAGTTNAMRVLGKKAGVITYIGDMAIAVIAGLAVRGIFGIWLDEPAANVFLLVLYTGMGVVLGHNYPFYMGFKGGKGIAASSGVIVSLFDWKLAVLALVTFAVITIVSKYVSLGSICMMAGFCVEFIVFCQLGWLPPLSGSSHRLEAYILVVLFSALAIFKHRSNIGRLISGTERKIGQKKEVVNTAE